MIKINGDTEQEFINISDFYKWLTVNKTIDNINIEGSDEAKNLYKFVKFYIETKKICSNGLSKKNNEFLDYGDNELVCDSVKELIRMNSDGKFVRATLIALGYQTFNNNVCDEEKYLPLATAYETFETAILIHDDIIDNAKVRRGKETIPEKYKSKFNKKDINNNTFEKKNEHISNSLGICIGDLGFYLASKIIIQNYKNDDSFDKIIDLYNRIVINTIKGEIIDVELPFLAEYNYLKETSEKDVMEIYRLKTAWYSIIGPYLLGATLGGASEEYKNKMEGFLCNLGIAFQIKDDILGIYGNEKEIGKSSSLDITEFKQTILYSYIVENCKEELKELHKYYGKDNLSEKDISCVKDIFEKTGARKYAEEKMKLMFEESKKALEKIDFIDNDYKNILYGFMTYLLLRTK